MFKSILNLLADFFSGTSSEFETSEVFRDLERKKDQVRIMIQGRLL